MYVDSMAVDRCRREMSLSIIMTEEKEVPKARSRCPDTIEISTRSFDYSPSVEATARRGIYMNGMQVPEGPTKIASKR